MAHSESRQAGGSLADRANGPWQRDSLPQSRMRACLCSGLEPCLPSRSCFDTTLDLFDLKPMKILKLQRVLFASLCLLGILDPPARGALYQPALTLTANPPGPKADYSLGGLYFNVDAAGTLTTVTFTLGGGFAYFSVPALSTFDVNYVQSNRPWSGNIGDKTNSLATPFNVPFYLGYYVQSGNPSATISANTNDGYGWAELIRGVNGLSLIDSALQYPSGGIIVGTTTAVPEPGTDAAVALGALILFGAWCSKGKQSSWN